MKKYLELNRVSRWNVAAITFIIGFLLFPLCTIISNLVSNNFDVSKTFYNGYRPTVIISESMEPTCMTNCVVLLQDVPFDEIKEDDIILFETKEVGSVIHRVYTSYKDDKEYLLWTKGDNNSRPDDWTVTKDMYRGKVVKIYNWLAPIITILFGAFVNPSISHLAFGFIVIACCLTSLIWILNGIWDFIVIWKCIKKDIDNVSDEGFKSDYFGYMNLRHDYQDLYSELFKMMKKSKDLSFIKRLVLRFHIMRVYNAMVEERSLVERVDKRFNKYRRFSKKYNLGYLLDDDSDKF